MYDWNEHHLTLIPIGLDDPDGVCPDDIFWKVDSVEIDPLEEGAYSVELIGRETTYYGTFLVPADAPDSLFQFFITIINKNSGDVVLGHEVMLHVYSPIDTQFTDTTNSEGYVEFAYFSSTTDSLCYGLREAHVAQTWIEKGIPEVMEIGIRQ
ncbi:MAG: hypothetical protein E3J78_04090 [Candidatus Cloacimonadota bacterium]|nr:MAG: hypothetical protein E3J78_04090 [Candidatus Cloacimonadota bacterium]